MWRFIKKAFAVITTFFNLSYVNSLEYISVSNQECKVRPKITDINNNESVFYPYSIKVNKGSRRCSNINDPYAKLCVPDIIKNINVKVFNLMLRINETRQIIWHETCICVCRLTSAVCNSREIWNKNKCRCKCKEDLVNKTVFDKGYIWNPSSCACGCDTSGSIEQYLDYKSCVCRNSLVDKLVEECTSAINEDKIYNKTLTVTLTSDCISCTLYVILFAVFLSTSVLISGAFVYYWYLKKNAQLNSEKTQFVLNLVRVLKKQFID